MLPLDNSAVVGTFARLWRRVRHPVASRRVRIAPPAAESEAEPYFSLWSACAIRETYMSDRTRPFRTLFGSLARRPSGFR